MATPREKSDQASINGAAADQGTINDAGPSTDELSKAAQAATRARVRAEEAKAKAHGELAEAKDALAGMDAKLQSGDSSITHEAYGAAAFRVKQAEGLAHKADEELIAAVQAEQVAVAQAAASDLLDGTASRETLDGAVAEGVEAVTTAVQAVLEVVRRRNAALQAGLAAARSAGLVDGQADPFSPVLVGRQSDPKAPWRKPTEVLLVNGEPSAPLDPAEVIHSALARAVKAAGLEIQVGGGR